MNNQFKYQTGATLIVSLVILAVITILGVASMRASNLELRMAASARDRAVAFQLAESALMAVERELAANPFPVASFLPTCTGNRCFKPNCANGLCFSGDLDGAVYRDDCRIARSDNSELVVEHWRKGSYWKSDSTPTISVLSAVRQKDEEEFENVTTQIPYMIEFMCFVPKDDRAIDDGENSRNSGVPLYRITVQASGEAGRATVMLQSVFRAAE
jgi:type IV pilus assembly protein PilX